MKTKTGKRDSVTTADILNGHTYDVIALTKALQLLIIETIPYAEERAYPVWHGIGYRHPETGYFCGLFPQKTHVKMAFEHGIHLDDPDDLLEGDGKQVRYVRIAKKSDIRKRPLQRLILNAATLDVRLK